jgi:hypothetical protein
MLVRDAKALAGQWVLQEAVNLHGFQGAFYHGSVNELADGALYPTSSDLDICVALDSEEVPPKPGKFPYHGVLLEVSYVSWDEVCSPEKVLAQYHLAGSFRGPSIILDPSGKLTQVQAVVSANFPKEQWVRKRCQHAMCRILHGLMFDKDAALPDQVNAWLFPAGITTHVLLVAGLKNPTVRKRFVSARKLLADYGFMHFYPELLDLLGCTYLTPQQVEQGLQLLEVVFDLAKEVPNPPFFFASDVSDGARHIAIDGSRDLISTGSHREAVFWILATLCRCHKILAFGGSPEALAKADQSLWDFLGLLGIESRADIAVAQARVKAILPEVWEVAEGIIEKNGDIIR